MTKEQIAEGMRALQLRIVEGLEKVDGKEKFKTDQWTREAGGGGYTMTLSNGDVIEKRRSSIFCCSWRSYRRYEKTTEPGRR